MRKIIWNIYAWPLTLLLVISFFMAVDKPVLLFVIDTLLSILALTTLHLHIWEKKLLSTWFWKIFAFVFLAWDFILNILLEPLRSGEPFDSTLLIVPVILLPLYIALFRYGFRNWDDEKDLHK